MPQLCTQCSKACQGAVGPMKRVVGRREDDRHYCQQQNGMPKKNWRSYLRPGNRFGSLAGLSAAVATSSFRRREMRASPLRGMHGCLLRRNHIVNFEKIGRKVVSQLV